MSYSGGAMLTNKKINTINTDMIKYLMKIPSMDNKGFPFST